MEIDILDLNILKVLVTNEVKCIQFIHSYNNDIFTDETKLFGKLLIKYISSFKSAPTRRTLIEWYGEGYIDYINTIWDKIDAHQYDINEYNFDLQKITNRYVNNKLNFIGSYINNQNTQTSLDQKVKDVGLQLQAARNIRNGRSHTQKTVAEHIDEFNDACVVRAESPEASQAVLTHYSAVDYATGGLLPAEFFIVAAETGGGKSTLLNNIGKQIWFGKNDLNSGPCDFEKGKNILYISLEMPYEECFSRFLASVAQVPFKNIINGNLASDEYDRIKQASLFIKEYPYQFDIVDYPRGFSIEDLELVYNDALLKYNPDVVIIDYMGLMKGQETHGGSEPDWLKIGDLAGQIHEFGRAFKVVMGSAVQLTDMQRGSKSNIKKKQDAPLVGAHRIGRSSHILHHVNLAIQIETRHAEESYGDMRYHIIKNRKGPNVSASLRKNFEMCILYDIPFVPDEYNVREITNNSEDDNQSNTVSTKQLDISSTLEQVRSKIKNIQLRSRL